MSLLRAARTAKREDRLTEIFSVVLAAHRGLAMRLLKESGLLDGRGAPMAIEVATQVRTHRNKLVDLQLVGLDKDGSVAMRLWSEIRES
jgi:hypothetical protein